MFCFVNRPKQNVFLLVIRGLFATPLSIFSFFLFVFPFFLDFLKTFIPLISVLPSFSLIFIFCFPFLYSYFPLLIRCFFFFFPNLLILNIILFFFYHFFSLFFSICANVFSFILLSFSWFGKRHWMNNSEQVHVSSERKVYFINFWIPLNAHFSSNNNSQVEELKFYIVRWKSNFNLIDTRFFWDWGWIVRECQLARANQDRDRSIDLQCHTARHKVSTHALNKT